MSVNVFTKTGNKSSSKVTLSKDVFALEVESHNLLKQAYQSILSNQRSYSARTLERGEVRGGGRKPWKQKGTGRARAGSIRSPLWRGGGVTFGPTDTQNFKKKINKKAKITAMKQALSLNKDNISIIDGLDLKAKTKNAADLFKKLGLERRILLIAEKTQDVERAVNNISNVTLKDYKEVNVVDVLDSDSILIEKSALENLEKRLGGSNE